MAKHALNGDVDVDVYAVGVLWVLLALARAACSRDSRVIAFATGKARYEVRYIFDRARAGEWREVRNAFNGYLAEPRTQRGTRSGHGWTKRRALRDLRAHLEASGG